MAPGSDFSRGQVSELQRVIDLGWQISGLSFGIFVGDLPSGRDSALARHAELADAPAAVLVAVDPVARCIEIVTGSKIAAYHTSMIQLAAEHPHVLGSIDEAVRLRGEALARRRAPVGVS
jgi:hypothetical protein